MIDGEAVRFIVIVLLLGGLVAWDIAFGLPDWLSNLFF